MEDLLRAALMNALTASALAVVVAGLGLVLSRRPAVVHCLWLIVLAKLAVPPLFEAPLGSLATGLEAIWREAPAEPEPIVIALAPIDEGPETMTLSPFESFAAIDFEPEEHVFTSAEWAIPWRAIGLVWLAGAVAMAAVAMIRVVRFQRLLNNADPAGDDVGAEVAKLAARMGLKRVPRAVLVEGRLAPLLWAVGRDPRLVLPRTLWKGLNARQRSLLLAHELAHWRRGDHRVRFLELAVTVAYWWLPVVWLVRRALRDAEEQCCDAWVVWLFPDEARAYAETLLDAVDFLNPVAGPEPLLASGFGKATHLRRRLVMVMKGTTPRSLGWAGSLGALALAGILLPTNPIWAQKNGVIEFKTAPIEAVAVDVAKIDKDAVIDIEADGLAIDPTKVARVVEGKAIRPQEAAEIHVISRGGSDEARQEAVKKMLERLGAQVKELEEKEEPTQAEKAVKLKLESLIEQLEKDASTRDKAKADAKAEETTQPMRIYLGYSTTPTATREMAVTSLVERLKAQAKQLLEKENPTDAQKEWARKAHAAAEKLEELAKTTEDGAFSFEGGTIILQGPGSRPASPDDLIARGIKDPQSVEAAHKYRLELLSRQLAAQQQLVAEMGRQLAEANRRVAELRNELIRESGWVIPGVNLRLKETRPTAPAAREQDRLKQLEGKLSKALEEVESLKKQKSEAGPRR